MLPAMEYAGRFGAQGQYVAKLYPSGDFTLGTSQPVTTDKKLHPLKNLIRASDGQYLLKNAIDEIEINNARTQIPLYTQQGFEGGVLPGCDPLGKDHLAERSLVGLSVATNCHRLPKSRRGLNGVTASNKRMIKSGWVILDQRHGKHCLQFGTATLPPLPPDELEIVCKNWGKLVKKFMQEIGRMLERKGYDKDYIHVTEIQEERYLKTGDVYPHLHWVCMGKNHRFQSDWAIDKFKVRALWSRMLSNLLGREVPCPSGTRVEMPKQSLTKELGKYLSKGGKLIKQIIKDGKGDFLPSSYCGFSNKLKAAINREIVKLTGELANDFRVQLAAFSAAGYLKFREVCIEYQGRTLTVGWVGYFVDDVVFKQLRLAA